MVMFYEHLTETGGQQQQRIKQNKEMRCKLCVKTQGNNVGDRHEGLKSSDISPGKGQTNVNRR